MLSLKGTPSVRVAPLPGSTLSLRCRPRAERRPDRLFDAQRRLQDPTLDGPQSTAAPPAAASVIDAAARRPLATRPPAYDVILTMTS